MRSARRTRQVACAPVPTTTSESVRSSCSASLYSSHVMCFYSLCMRPLAPRDIRTETCLSSTSREWTGRVLSPAYTATFVPTRAQRRANAKNPVVWRFVSCSICIETRRYLPRIEAASTRSFPMSCAKWRTSSTDAIRVLLRFIGMPQRSLASLVLGPVLIGVLCLALACVAGARTDKLGDTLSVADTLHAIDSARADTVRKIDSTRSAAADSAASSQLAVVIDSATLKQQSSSQQGTTKTDQKNGGGGTGCCEASPRMHRHGERPLSPVADSIANGLVFVPRDRAWFPVASRGRHMLVDIGRIDLNLKPDSVSRAGYLEAVTRLSPLPIGTVLRVRAPYGIDEQAKITGYDTWHGRIVARLSISQLLDSLARAEDMLPAAAMRFDTAAARAVRVPDTTQHVTTTPTTVTNAGSTTGAHTDSVGVAPPPPCVHDTLPTDLATRAIFVRDSLVRFLTDSAKPPY